MDSESLLTLTAINAGKLQQQSAVNNQFVSEVIANPALPLGGGLWVTDAVVGNEKNAVAFSRAKKPFQNNGKTVQAVLTVAAVNDQINPLLARLLEPQVQQTLLQGNAAQIVSALNGETPVQAVNEAATPVDEHQANAAGTVVGTFTVRNEHGLHARPSAVLVNEVKKFAAKITVQNLTRGSDAVSAKSLMKIVALGVTQGHRLRFVAEGEDAQAAIEALGKVIAEGLGESVSAQPLQEADSIEVIGAPTTPVAEKSAVENLTENASSTENSVEGIFVIQNEHGLHARPSAILVNEVKKYNAAVTVQNLDRDSQPVSAKSLMKIVALGVVKGHRLRFVATGEQAQQAIDGIGAAIAAGLGE